MKNRPKSELTSHAPGRWARWLLPPSRRSIVASVDRSGRTGIHIGRDAVKCSPQRFRPHANKYDTGGKMLGRELPPSAANRSRSSSIGPAPALVAVGRQNVVQENQTTRAETAAEFLPNNLLHSRRTNSLASGVAHGKRRVLWRQDRSKSEPARKTVRHKIRRVAHCRHLRLFWLSRFAACRSSVFRSARIGTREKSRSRQTSRTKLKTAGISVIDTATKKSGNIQ